MLGALLTWMYSAREDGLKWAVASGLLLGLGVLTKLPAVLVVPAMAAWDVAQTRGLAWIRTRRTVATVLSALVVMLPWYGTRLALDSAKFARDQSNIVGVAAGFLKSDTVRALLVEPFWMMSAFALACVVAGAVVMARRREPGDLTVAAFLASMVVFLMLFHYHTYYLLPATPILALMAGRGLGAVNGARFRSVVAILATVVLVGMALSSALMLSGNKWGQWSPVVLQGIAAQSPGSTSVVVAAGLWDNSLGPAMQLYLPKDTVIREGGKVIPGAKQTIFIGPADGHDPEARQLAQTRVRPVIFGCALWQDPANVNFFQNGRWVAEKVGPMWRFGIQTDEFGSRFASSDITVAP